MKVVAMTRIWMERFQIVIGALMIVFLMMLMEFLSQ